MPQAQEDLVARVEKLEQGVEVAANLAKEVQALRVEVKTGRRGPRRLGRLHGRLTMGVRPVVVAALVGIAVLVQSTSTLDAEPLYCSTWNGIRVCSGPGGHTSTEWGWHGMRLGQDSDGNRWTTSRWRDFETTTVTRPER